mgnify:CR=1 FL=1
MSLYVREIDIVAIVPARSGSKRLPRKNVLPLAGKPLIQWTLDVAKESSVIDLTVVTSDDEEILEIADRNEGVKSFRRPKHLATDSSTTADTILHTLELLNSEGIVPKRVLLLQPTSPLRNSLDIENAVKCHNENLTKTVVSVCQVDHPSAWCGNLDSNGCLVGLDVTLSQSQSADKEYRINGAIYLSSVTKFIETKRLFDCKSKVYIMPRDRGVDIDEWIDFKLCELIIENNGAPTDSGNRQENL